MNFVKIITTFLLISIFSASSCIAHNTPDFSPDTDYAALMIESAVSGDIRSGRQYEEARNRKISALNCENTVFTFDDLYLLAKVVEAEAGSDWLSIEHKKLVASVVVNRAESPEFPPTIHEVVYQKGQYETAGTYSFEKMIPSKSSVQVASQILQFGSIAPSAVVFQAEFKQGSGVYKSIYDSVRNRTTYFCYSSNPDFYS